MPFLVVGDKGAGARLAFGYGPGNAETLINNC